MKTCAFTGGRPERFSWGEDESDADCLALKSKIAETLKGLLKEGYTHFISGMARGADTYCAEQVLKLKEHGAPVTLECAIPCPEQTKGWSIGAHMRWQSIIDRADKLTVVSPHYTRFCMSKRNAYMVENSDAVLAVWNGAQHGGTYNTIKTAQRLGVPLKIIEYKS